MSIEPGVGRPLSLEEILEYWKNAKEKWKKNPPPEYDRRKEPILYPVERRKNAP